MALTTIGLSGLISATGSTDMSFLIGTSTKPYAANIDLASEVFDSTGFASTAPIAISNIPGLKSWSGGFSGKFPQASPASGHEGLVTFANGYVLGCRGWSITATVQEFENTGQASTPPTWMDYIPGLYSFSGYFDVLIDDTTALATVGTSGAATFRLSTESTNDNELSGTIITNSRSTPIVVNDRPIVRYGFVVDGVISVDGDAPLFDVAVAGTPDPLVRPQSTAITVRANGDIDYTGNAFLTGWTVGSAIGSPVEVQATFRGTGALTDNS